jgi:hypothetical protein
VATIKTPPRTGVVTTTTGTGSYALGSALAQGGDTLFTFAEAKANGWISDGDQIAYTCKNASGGFEEGIGTFNFGANTLARTTVRKSSNGNAAVSWAAGDKSLFVGFLSDGILLPENNLSEVNPAAARASLGSTTVGDALFIATSAAVARTVVGLDDARVTLSSGQSGGTVGKFVRPSAANTWADASQADTIAQLGLVVFKESSGLYIVSGRITLSGLTAGAEYFLSTAGGYVTPTPTPSSTVRSRRLGVAINTTELMMFQSVAFGGS